MNDKSYANSYSKSDNILMEEIGSYIKKSRLNRNLTQHKVAQEANISRSTLSLLENGESVSLSTLIQVLRTLESLHVLNDFQIKNQISPLAIAKQQKEERQRARSQANNTNKSDW
jgi:transcriptional regulator with XRE-family HTH domain